jgi:hypothetical protein
MFIFLFWWVCLSKQQLKYQEWRKTYCPLPWLAKEWWDVKIILRIFQTKQLMHFCKDISYSRDWRSFSSHSNRHKIVENLSETTSHFFHWGEIANYEKHILNEQEICQGILNCGRFGQAWIENWISFFCQIFLAEILQYTVRYIEKKTFTDKCQYGRNSNIL